jgi:diphthamide synthase (EF-2-diphthine--ammonia ligase)
MTDYSWLRSRCPVTRLWAVLTCVDPKQLDKRFGGRQYDEMLLADLPAEVDPFGERGEFHTVCYGCPESRSDIRVTLGDVIERDGFWFADLCSVETSSEWRRG